MKKLAKYLAAMVVTVAILVVALTGLAWWHSERALGQRFVIADPPLPPVSAAGIDHGRHLFESRGCSDCHGARGEGRVVMDVLPARMVASNLTPAGVGGRHDRDSFARSIRHGVAHDGRPLRLMPIEDYAEMSDDDVAALADYLGTLPPIDHDPGTTTIYLPGRLFHLFSLIDLVPGERVDHSPRVRHAPAPAATVEYGRYLAHTCRGCHGADYRGQRVPGTPPDMPPASDLTALAAWQSDDFTRAMREGVRPDGSALHPLMPWKAFSAMTDMELGALWLHFDDLRLRSANADDDA